MTIYSVSIAQSSFPAWLGASKILLSELHLEAAVEANADSVLSKRQLAPFFSQALVAHDEKLR
jgi:hypothetical protein